MSATKKRITKPVTPRAAAAPVTKPMDGLPHPRPYLSWSQLNKWESNPLEYIQQYVLGDMQPTNAAMEFGSYVHAALEHDNDFDDPVLEHLLTVFPKFDQREFIISTTAGSVPVYGKLDGYEPEQKIIAEFKTGRKWTTTMVERADQLTFYSMLHYCKFNELPWAVRLYWLPTQTVDGEVSPAGMVQVFQTKRSIVDVLRMADRVKRAWETIGQATEKEYRRLGLA